MYADDTVLKSTIIKEYIAHAHQSALLEVSDWLKKNKLTLNVKKPKPWATFGPKKLKEDLSNVFLNDTQIEDLECIKILSIHYNSELNFHQHFDQI